MHSAWHNHAWQPAELAITPESRRQVLSSVPRKLPAACFVLLHLGRLLHWAATRSIYPRGSIGAAGEGSDGDSPRRHQAKSELGDGGNSMAAAASVCLTRSWRAAYSAVYAFLAATSETPATWAISLGVRSCPHRLPA